MFTKKKLFKQLTVLGKLYFKKIKGEEKISEEPPNKKQKTSQGMINTHTWMHCVILYRFLFLAKHSMRQSAEIIAKFPSDIC